MIDSRLMTRAADNIRILAASMVEQAKSGHPGGAMGGADYVNVLFSKYIVTDPDNPSWFARDRFFLDPGHMSPMLYSVLHLAGRYKTDDLKAFRSWGSITPGHPELDVEHGVENTSGPLGQGHVMAVGAAIAERFIATHYSEVFAHKTYAFISDGGVQEGISQEAARIAGYLGLNNLIMFYDSNTVQLSTDCDAVSNEDTAMKYRAWNWNVIECDGTDPVALADALDKAIAETERPTIIIGRTIMGRGCVTAEGENFEGKCSTHGNPLSKSGADFGKTIEHLGGNPENPWVVFPEVAELYAQRAAEQRELVAKRKKEIDAKLEDIIAFSECRQFIDTPVKRYSSGMYVKLAFAVAAHLDSEIMVMDEVLAVGDMAFQKKCLDKMSDVSRSQGRTILYVSHNMNTIRQLCDRCIVLDKGKVIFNGSVDEAITVYMGENLDDECRIDLSNVTRLDFIKREDLRLISAEYLNKSNIIFDKREPLLLRLKWKNNKENYQRK